MSIECGICERDLRGGHDPSCPRYRAPCCDQLDEEGWCPVHGQKPDALDRLNEIEAEWEDGGGPESMRAIESEIGWLCSELRRALETIRALRSEVRHHGERRMSQPDHTGGTDK